MMKKTFLLIAFLGMNLVNGEYLYLKEGETIEQAIYRYYGLKVENGKLLWYDPRVSSIPNRRIMRSEAATKYGIELYKKNNLYPKVNKVITNAAIIFDLGYFGNAYPSVKESQERKYTVIVDDKHVYPPRLIPRHRLFYRFTKKKKLEFSEDKKTWEKVKVELVYEDFELKKDPPQNKKKDPRDPMSILFKLRISCKWFDEVFVTREPHH